MNLTDKHIALLSLCVDPTRSSQSRERGPGHSRSPIEFFIDTTGVLRAAHAPRDAHWHSISKVSRTLSPKHSGSSRVHDSSWRCKGGCLALRHRRPLTPPYPNTHSHPLPVPLQRQQPSPLGPTTPSICAAMNSVRSCTSKFIFLL